MALTLAALALASAATGVQPALSDDADTAPQTVIVRGRRIDPQTASFTAQVLEAPAPGLTVDDLPAKVPGLWLINDQDPGTNILSIRAATTDRLQQASVAMVVDGVALADTEFFTGPLFDLDRIAVLKGPQGALFGKNASGGAILITSRDADDPGALALTLGDGGLRRVELAASHSGDGTFGVRAALLYSRHDGWITNRTLGKLVDGQELAALRLTGSARLPGDWNLTGRVSTMEERGGAAWASSNNITGLAGGRLDGAVLTDPIGDYEGRAARTWTQGSLTASGPLAGGAVRLVVARDIYAKRWREELDYRPGPLTFFGQPLFPQGLQPIQQPIDLRVWTGEASWSRDSGPWTITLGSFAQKTSRDRVDDFGPLLFGGPALAYATGSRQLAVFGGVRFAQGPWSVDLEARFDEDQRSQTITNSVTGARVERRDGTFSRLQPRIGVTRELSSASGARTTVFASYGEAFRPGGFNPIPGPASIWQPTYRPELTRALEIGARFGWGQASVFRNRVTDYQNYTFLDGQSVTLSVPEVTVDGFEIAGQTPAWERGALTARLTGALAWNDARLGRFIATDPLLGSPATRDYSGKQVPNAPLWTGNLALAWTLATGTDGALDGRVQINGAGRTVFELDNVLHAPARAWADLAVGYQATDSWRLELSVRNLTDERWAVSAFGQGMLGLLAGLGPDGPFDTFTLNRGRQASLTLSWPL